MNIKRIKKIKNLDLERGEFMYTTKQAISKLLKSRMGLTFKMVNNNNIHIFKNTEGKICKGEYGDGWTIELEEGMYNKELWEIDFRGSCLKDY